jgi:hypothetical protein
MLSSREFQRSVSRLLDSAPLEFQRRQGTYRVSQCEEREGAIACSTFRSQMASLLDSLGAGGSPIVLVHRKGMGAVKSYYIVEKIGCCTKSRKMDCF